jgi:hypothetical protein
VPVLELDVVRVTLASAYVITALIWLVTKRDERSL